MDYINPLFNNNEKTKLKRPAATKNEKHIRTRSVRSDKCRNIKFPIDTLMQIKLKSFAKQAARIYRAKGKEALSQTKFNTLLLRYGLENGSILCWNHEYKDTKVYMHTNILETEYEEIGGPHGLSVRKGLSDRKVVYQIMFSVLKWLEGEGSLEKII